MRSNRTGRTSATKPPCKAGRFCCAQWVSQPPIGVCGTSLLAMFRSKSPKGFSVLLHSAYAPFREIPRNIAGLRFSLALLLVVFCMLVALCATSLLDAACAVNLVTTNVLPAVNGENALYTVNLFSNIFYALSALPNLSIKTDARTPISINANP